MIVLWVSSLLVVSAVCNRVHEPQAEDESNVTTLYPVNKNTKNNSNTTKRNNNVEEDNPSKNKIKEAATAWKIDAQFAQNELQNDNNGTESKEQVVLEKPEKVFKPSPHIESYFETDFGQYYHELKKPPIGFKFAKDFPQYPSLDIPTKNGWKIARPITVQAGDLYKIPDALKANDGADLGLDVDLKNVNQNGIKKKINPWKNLLRLVTTFIPVGLIISALTPSVVTIQSSGSRSPIRNMHRRSDAGQPRISEECRKRIICELRSSKGLHTSKHRKSKQHSNLCSQWECEDETVLRRLLPWLMQEWPITSNTRGDQVV